MIERHPHLLRRDQAALIIIDMQEKFEKAIVDFSLIEEKIVRLIEGSKILNLPIYYTEQYPKGLGRTTSKISSHLADLKPIEKNRFSAADEQFIAILREKQVSQIILTGIEAHVCVLQSALDFYNLGFQVHVVSDATGSRTVDNRAAALARMRSQGVIETVVESVLFELLETSGTDEFRRISKILK